MSLPTSTACPWCGSQQPDPTGLCSSCDRPLPRHAAGEFAPAGEPLAEQEPAAPEAVEPEPEPPPEQRVCLTCGQLSALESPACPGCGHAFRAPPTPHSEEAEQPRASGPRWRLLGWGAAAAALALVGLAALIQLGGPLRGAARAVATPAALATTVGGARQEVLVALGQATPVPPAPEPGFTPRRAQLGPLPAAAGSYRLELALEGLAWWAGDAVTRPPSGHTFVLVSVALTNLGPAASPAVSAADFQVRDAAGVLRGDELVAPTRDCRLRAAGLGAGETARGCLAFEVPTAGGLELVYSPYAQHRLDPGRYLSLAVREG